MNDELFRKQEQDPATRKLSHLLGSIAVPAKTDLEWNDLSNKVFSRLNAQGVRPRSEGSVSWIKSLSGRSALAFASLALVVAAGAGIFQVARVGSPASLQARVVRTEGSACRVAVGMAEVSSAGMWESVSTASQIQAGRLLSTGDHSGLTVALESGTGFQLFDNSRLSIVRADARGFVAILEKGDILFEVGKRKKGQVFRILTPNAQCEIAGTIFRVSVDPGAGGAGNTTTLQVLEGKVKFFDRSTAGNQVMVPAGFSSVVREKAPETPEVFEQSQGVAARLQLLGTALSAPSSGWGNLSVTSEPSGAQVFVNGYFEGLTPLLSVKQPDNYAVSVSYLNFETKDTSVHISQDTCSAVTLALKGAITKVIRVREAKTVVEHRPRWSLLKSKRVATRPAEEERAAITSTPAFLKASSEAVMGNYEKAIGLLDQISSDVSLSDSDKLSVLVQMKDCYKHLGNFQGMASVLEQMYDVASDPVRKGNILWELISVKVDRLGDFEDAEMDLVEYMVTQPGGIWLYEAYGKMAEVQYVRGEFKAAYKTYAKMISSFSGEPDIDRAVYALAHIMRQNLDDCNGAVRWYTTLLKDHPRSTYVEDAVFWRAECLLRLGRVKDARNDYAGYESRYPQGRWKQAVAERVAGLRN